MSPVEARTETILALVCALLSDPTFGEVLSNGRPHAIEPLPACKQRKERVFNVLFDRVDVEKLIQTAADVTCRTFIVPDNVKGKISIIGPDDGQGKISAEEFYSAFLAALDVSGLTVLPSGAFFRIIEKSRAGRSPIETVTDSSEVHRTNEEMVTRLFQLRNAELESIRGVLAQLISPGAEMVPFPPNTLIVTEIGSNLQRIEKVVAQLDVAPADQLQVIQVRFASAQDVADKVQRFLDKSRNASAK